MKSVADVIAAAKARPGELNYASSGNGSGQHLFMAQFAAMAGIKLVHVPYRGSGQATTDLLAGTVPMAMPGTAGMVGHIKAGKLRPLATSGSTRSPQLPDVPTLAESGLAGYSAYVWMGLLAPKGTPAAIIDKLSRELKIVMALPEVKSHFAEAGIEIVSSTPAEMDSYFREERDHWARVVKDPAQELIEAKRTTNMTQVTGQEHWTTKKTADGAEVKLFLWEKFVGSPEGKPAVLFVHGSSMASQPTFDLTVPGRPDSSVMDWFAQRGFVCWCVDMEGYGRSTRRATSIATSPTARPISPRPRTTSSRRAA